jgi:hypothetical protein
MAGMSAKKMTDIVERIKARQSSPAQLTDEAATEIERLRAALHEMIELSQRNSDAQLMLIAIRRCARHALEET